MSMEDFLDKTFSAPGERCRQFSEVILEYVNTEHYIRILDLGCGTGKQLFDLAKVLPHAYLVGVDISKANIIIAENMRRQFPVKESVNFIAADYMTLKTDPFNIIISDSTLQNIPVTTQTLFSKIASDLLPGGLVLATIPSDCLYNRLLWSLRRFFRAIRSPFTDSLIFKIGKFIHGKHLSEELLRERVHYMYLVPDRYYSQSLTEFLHDSFNLELLKVHPVPHASLAQPKHMFTVFRKKRA